MKSMVLEVFSEVQLQVSGAGISLQYICSFRARCTAVKLQEITHSGLFSILLLSQ